MSSTYSAHKKSSKKLRERSVLFISLSSILQRFHILIFTLSAGSAQRSLFLIHISFTTGGEMRSMECAFLAVSIVLRYVHG